MTRTKEASVTQARQMVEAQKEKDTQLKKDDRVLIPDVISEQMAEEYIKDEGLDDNEPSDAENHFLNLPQQISTERRPKTCLTRLAHVRQRYLNITIN